MIEEREISQLSPDNPQFFPDNEEHCQLTIKISGKTKDNLLIFWTFYGIIVHITWAQIAPFFTL